MIPTTPSVLKIALIKAAVESLSVPPGMYEKAIERYEAVTAFLEKPGTLVAPWKPYQCILGSAALGLAVRPFDKEEFDFDISCELTPPPALRSKEVRDQVKRRLREDANYSRMLNTEKQRCLRLDYAASEKFHLDIVVARVARWLSQTGTAVQVPDKAVEQWIGSDPRGYIAWFKKRQTVVLPPSERVALLSEVRAKTEPAPAQPDPDEKLPIQWVIQIMKRHRDLMYQGAKAQDAPISAIITTLAAKAYGGQADILETLEAVTLGMIHHFDDSGKTRVSNPALATENFANKWPVKPQRRQAFFDWHARFTAHVRAFLCAEKLTGIGAALDNLVGEPAKSVAFAKHASLLQRMQNAGSLGIVTAAATLGSTLSGARAIPRHTNFGRDVV